VFTNFAAEQASGGLLGALGIDGRLFVTQLVAFLVLLAILKKWVYPPIIRSIDKRQESLDATVKEASEARKALEKAESKADEILVSARKEADALLARSNDATATAILSAETKAKERAEQIVADARVTLICVKPEHCSKKKQLHWSLQLPNELLAKKLTPPKMPNL